MIYLIQSGQNFKIGTTKNLEKRLKQYQTHNPNIVVVSTRKGGKEEENLLHFLLSDYFINDTEWMRYDPFIIDLFNKVHLDNLSRRRIQVNCKKTIVYSNSNQKIEEFENFNDSCYRIFIDYSNPLYQLSSDSARKVLMYMCKIVQFNNCSVSLPTGERIKICNKCNISNNTITNSLASLKKLGIIFGDKGKFYINPKIIWKGDLSVRNYFLNDSEFMSKFNFNEK